jgi:hypothetical protein
MTLKLKELFNLEKSINQKKDELEMLERELIELKNSFINISNVYVIKKNKITYFVTLGKKCDFDEGIMLDIFTNTTVISWNNENELSNQLSTFKHIRNVFPEVNIFQDENVPIWLLQELYYRANNIDKELLEKINGEDAKIKNKLISTVER